MPKLEELRALDVILTDRCNLRCEYCFQTRRGSAGATWGVVRSAVDLLLASTVPEAELRFTGGEPMLALNLMRRAVDRAESARGKSPRVRYVLSTNGTLIDAQAVEFLAAHDFLTQVSLDGVRAAQRGRGQGTHSIVERTLVQLRQSHPLYFRRRVQVGLTLTARNLKYLANSVKYLVKLGVKNISIGPLFTHDPGWTAGAHGELNRQVEKVFRFSERHFKKTVEVPFKPFRKQGDGAPGGRPPELMCGIGGGTDLTVDVDGQVFGCMTVAESFQEFPNDFLRTRLAPMHLGSISDPGLSRRLARLPKAVRAAGIFGRRTRKYSSFGRCAECAYVSTCLVCPVSIGHIPGNSDPDRIPDNQCAYNLVLGKWRARFPAQPHPIEILLGRAPGPRWMEKLRPLVEAKARSLRRSSH